MSGRPAPLVLALVEFVRERPDGAGQLALTGVVKALPATFLEPGPGAGFVHTEPSGQGEDAGPHFVELRRRSGRPVAALVQVVPELLAELPQSPLDAVGNGTLAGDLMSFGGRLADEAAPDITLRRATNDGHPNGDGVETDSKDLPVGIGEACWVVGKVADDFGAPAIESEDAIRLADDGRALEVGEDTSVAVGALLDKRGVERLGEEVERLSRKPGVLVAAHAARRAPAVPTRWMRG